MAPPRSAIFIQLDSLNRHFFETGISLFLRAQRAAHQRSALAVTLLLGLLTSACLPQSGTSAVIGSATPRVAPSLTPQSALRPTATTPAPTPAPTAITTPVAPFRIVPCENPILEPASAPFDDAGTILLVAGDHGAGTYGLYQLSQASPEPRPLILEENWIGNIALSADGQRIIYATYAWAPIEEGGHNLFQEWVVTSVDGQVLQRFPDEDTVNPFRWALANDEGQVIRILRMPDGASGDSLDGYKVLTLPDGVLTPWAPAASLPALWTLSTRAGGAWLSIDPTLTHTLYYSYDPQTNESALNLRDVAANTTLWRQLDSPGIMDTGFGYSWRWSANGERIALTFSEETAKAGRLQGDIFTLDRSGQSFTQVSYFADVLPDGYFAIAGPWSPDGSKLLINVYRTDAIAIDQLYVADFVTRTITDTCARGSFSLFGWSPSATEVTIWFHPSGKSRALLVVDPTAGEVTQIASGVHWLGGWIP